MLNYNHLRYFWAVAHEGNLTRAAARLHVAQSAVSVQIRQLEDQLGHQLFERRGRRLELTEAGRIALDHADAIFEAGAELEGILQARATSARQVLRVGSLATLSRNFQLAFLAPMLGRADVELVIRSGGFDDLLRQLEVHRIDMVLANAAPPRDAATPWVAHVIAEQPIALVGPPAQREPERSLETLLAEEPLVLPSVPSSIRTGFDAMVDRMGIRPTIAAEVDDMAMLRLVAREHAGLAVLPSIVVQDELDSGVLVEVAHLPGLTETFHAITLARRFPNPLVRELLGTRDPGRPSAG
ncbi:MAG: LysR family transcriptional regulator [Gemmatimonadetes bacterium]|nr:LysR family transcriptional regulator [Gemmatimonadota bacterium]MCB9505981.1 LysR family transcriptional regulator [Gemmatimonadales bacterium]MCA9761970.1 LysR family transcriptional regulator [Gemmatimonadota bacterium]MCA9768922.1 LysR family transcriptional regulator [Gemmatimonadota bacterium]MCB9518540.1 LysR family transcriptional regulator [Gemmatimonadales bacterium]